MCTTTNNRGVLSMWCACQSQLFHQIYILFLNASIIFVSKFVSIFHSFDFIIVIIIIVITYHIHTHNIFKRKWRLELFFWHSLFCFLRCKKIIVVIGSLYYYYDYFLLFFILNEKFSTRFLIIYCVCVCYLGYNVSLVVFLN